MDPAETRTVTVLVTDMAGSTAFRAKWGDREADNARRAHMAIARVAVSSGGGTIIKGTGDGTLAVFASAAEAIGAAIAIQQRSIAERVVKHAPPIRIGLAAGDVTFEENDCFGRPVIEASRLESDAVADGILATKLVELLAAGRSEATFRDRGAAELKGFPDPVPISEVTFDIPDSAPVASDAPVAISPTRLSPPGLPGHVIARPRVDRHLADALNRRIVTVEAGAGYGKSTAATNYLLATETPWCWLSCDRRLAQPVAVAAHVCAAIAKVYPGFGLDRWPEAGPELARTFAEQVRASVAEPLVVCVDDVHSLSESVREALLGMVEQSEEPLRWLLLSREPIPISRRVALNAASPVTEVDLAFNQGESRALIEVLAPGSDRAAAQQIQTDTEGWPAGMILSVRGAGPSHSVDADAPFDYLAEEALGDLEPELVDFLERVSLPYRFNAEIALALTGRADAQGVITQLVDGHLFTIPLDSDDTWFRFHHLFRAFLRHRLENRSDVSLVDLNSGLARAWLGVNEPEEAVRCFLAAGDERNAARTLSPLFSSALVGTRYGVLRPLLKRVSPEIRQRYPDLVLAEAAGHLYDGRQEEAYQEYERSLKLLIENEQTKQAAAVLARYLFTMVTAGTALDQRIGVAERFLPKVSGVPREAAAAQILAAVAYGHSTRFEEAEALIEAALAADGSEPVVALASAVRGYYVSWPRGDVDLALSELDMAIAFGTTRGDEDIYSVGPFSNGLAAAVLPQIGRYAEAMVKAAETEAETVRRWGRTVGISRVVRWWRLMATTGMGDWSQATALGGNPAELLASPSDLWSYRLAAPYARLAASGGDVSLTRQLIRHGTKALSAGGQTMDGPMILSEFAHAASAVGLDDLRTRLAQQALTYASEAGLNSHSARASMLCADYMSGREGDAHLERALMLTQEHGYEFLWSRLERGSAGSLLGRAMQLRGWESYAAELAAIAGREVSRECAKAVRRSPEASSVLLRALLRSPDPDPEATRLAGGGGLESPEVLDAIRTRPRAPLALNGFGGLSVSRSGRTLEADAMKDGSPPAMILARLLCTWPKDVSVDGVSRELWANHSEADARAELGAATERLSQALDPWASHRDGVPVRRRRDQLWLELDARDRVEFDPLLAPDGWASMSVSRMMELERQTEGEFLPEYSSEEWVRAAALGLQSARVEFLIVFAERLRAEGQAAAAAERLAVLADRDPGREELHRRLMRCYVDAGEPARALRQYHTCRTFLLREHGIEPSAETRALFDAFV